MSSVCVDALKLGRECEQQWEAKVETTSCMPAIKAMGQCLDQTFGGVEGAVEAATKVCSPSVQAMFPTTEGALEACYFVTTAAYSLVAINYESASEGCQQTVGQCQKGCCEGEAFAQCSIELTGTETGLCQLATNMQMVVNASV
jgi:hypothetical protein